MLEYVLLLASSGAFAWCLTWAGAVSDTRGLLTGLITAFSRDYGALATLPKASPNTARDWPVLLIFTLGFYTCNWGLRLMVVEPLARYLGIRQGRDSAKFALSYMEALTYGSFTVLGLVVVPSQDFVWPSSLWWEGFANGGHEIMRSDLQCYYIMYMARYCSVLVSVLIEPKMKDFLPMLIHHSVTIMVIYVSYFYGWNRVGVVVMALLDPGDVPLHLAKLCKYIAEAGGHKMWQTMGDRLFELFGLVFVLTRSFCYGYVCWSAHIEASRYFDKGLPEWTCVALLYVLFALQLYWCSIIIKVVVKMIGGSRPEDIRENEHEQETHAHHD